MFLVMSVCLYIFIFLHKYIGYFQNLETILTEDHCKSENSISE